MPHISRLISRYMIERLGLTPERTRELRPRYWEEYGTTLRGLMQDFDVDPQDYLSFVHDFPVEEYLRPDPALGRALELLPLRKVVFTNASAEHGRRVLTALGVEGHFEAIFDIVFMDYVSKPAPDSFGKVLDALGTEGQECMMLDDNPVNLRVAATLGMTTVYVGSKRSECEADFTLPAVTQVDRLVPELIARGLLNHEPGESGQEEE